MTSRVNLNYDAIREYAERVGSHHDIYTNEGTANIQALVNKLGGQVTYGDAAESLVVRKKRDFTIVLPNMTSARRDRFTIAHELGHYFLHYLYEERSNEAAFGRGERNVVETQANVFAASLLMPSQQFRRAYGTVGGSSWKLAMLFDVSPAAAEVRCQVLGL